MTRKTILLGLLLFGFADLLLYSCCNCGDDVISQEFRYCSVELTNMNNAGASIQEAADTVLASAFALNVRIEFTSQSVCSSTPMLLNGAYASQCDCGSFRYLIADPVDDIAIYTTNALSPSIGAGSDVTALFYLYDSENYYRIANELYFINLSDIDPIERNALLMETPEFTGMHQFTIEITTQSGTVITNQSQPIYLK